MDKALEIVFTPAEVEIKILQPFLRKNPSDMKKIKTQLSLLKIVNGLIGCPKLFAMINIGLPPQCNYIFFSFLDRLFRIYIDNFRNVLLLL